MKKQKKSPLKNRPLRDPGQSADEEIRRIIGEEATGYILFPTIMVMFTAWHWLVWYQIIPVSNPVGMTIIVAGISVYCFFKMLKVKKKLVALRLGRDGEKAVGQTLDALKRKGYRIFHDLVGDGFNLDHVIVSEHGVFSVETKTYSKPKKGECKIIYSEQGISIDGYKAEKKILIQVAAQKAWLENRVASLTGVKVAVRPVVVFPGWYIENRNKGSEVWVLEPKALPSYIDNSPKILSEEKVRLISNHLSGYIRTSYDEGR